MCSSGDITIMSDKDSSNKDNTEIDYGDLEAIVNESATELTAIFETLNETMGTAQVKDNAEAYSKLREAWETYTLCFDEVTELQNNFNDISRREINDRMVQVHEVAGEAIECMAQAKTLLNQSPS